MNLVRSFFRFFIYSNLFIALCAVVMVYQTHQLFLPHLPAIDFISFVFFATICSYSFHWYLSPVESAPASSRSWWLAHHRNVHLILFVIGFAGAIVSAVLFPDHWHWLVFSAIITFLYSAPKIPHSAFRALRKVAIAKTIFLAFVWMYVTTVLPLQVSGQPWSTGFVFFAASRFFLIYSICIVFDLRDKEHDKTIGIRSLITWLSDRNITRLFIISLTLFAVLTCLLLRHGVTVQSVLCLLLPGMITAALYRYARRNLSDMLYYFILDGLMALSSLVSLMFIARHSK